MTAGWRLGGRPGDPVPPTLGCRKQVAQALGQGPRALAPGQRANCPLQLGSVPVRPVRLGEAPHKRTSGARREAPGGPPRRGDPRLGIPAAETRWGAGEGPGAEAREKECGAARVAGWEGGKLFPANPFSEDPS